MKKSKKPRFYRKNKLFF
jgi:hypothetical protein